MLHGYCLQRFLQGYIQAEEFPCPQCHAPWTTTARKESVHTSARPRRVVKRTRMQEMDDTSSSDVDTVQAVQSRLVQESHPSQPDTAMEEHDVAQTQTSDVPLLREDEEDEEQSHRSARKTRLIRRQSRRKTG